jgi:valyl-tRNA synthetase
VPKAKAARDLGGTRDRRGGASSAQDLRYSDERVVEGRELVTKLWNATGLVVGRGGRAR